MSEALPPALTPALTPEEWDDFLDPKNSAWAPNVFGNQSAHAAAATHLYGRAYGFTREDVEAMETLESWLDASFDRSVEKRYKRIIAKIKALLPPE